MGLWKWHSSEEISCFKQDEKVNYKEKGDNRLCVRQTIYENIKYMSRRKITLLIMVNFLSFVKQIKALDFTLSAQYRVV